MNKDIFSGMEMIEKGRIKKAEKIMHAYCDMIVPGINNIYTHCKSTVNWKKIKRFDKPTQHNDDNKNGDDEEVEKT